MPLRKVVCPVCKAKHETLSPKAWCNHDQEEDGIPFPVAEMKTVLTAPHSKFMENAGRGKSRLKDQTKILRERSRNFTRDHEADDMISLNDRNNLGRSGFLGKDGKKRKKIEDL